MNGLTCSDVETAVISVMQPKKSSPTLHAHKSRLDFMQNFL
jgi:hypothetical protein